jgi:SAM-dependent methyltransferase
MPLSIWNGMEDALRVIIAARPRSVLDAGIGFGLWGHLLRQYLDVWSGRVERASWQVRIDGIEIDPRRVQPHARHLYDEIEIGDIRDVVPRRAGERLYDVILFGDVIEHLPKDDGLNLIEQSARLAARLVVLRVPLGDGWRTKGRERPDDHLSRWSVEDFVPWAADVSESDFAGNPYALVSIDAAAVRTARIERLEARLAELEVVLAELGLGEPEPIS